MSGVTFCLSINSSLALLPPSTGQSDGGQSDKGQSDGDG